MEKLANGISKYNNKFSKMEFRNIITNLAIFNKYRTGDEIWSILQAYMEQYLKILSYKYLTVDRM